MMKLDIEEYITALDNFLKRYTCPNCEPNDKEQGFIDGVSYCNGVCHRTLNRECNYEPQVQPEQLRLTDFL